MTRHYNFLMATAAALLTISATTVQALTVTVESRCVSGGSYVEGGTGWGNSTAKSNRTPCGSGSRATKNPGAFADFIPTITTEGNYDVYLTWGTTTTSNDGPNAENVQASIIDNAGTTNYVVNMRGHTNCTVNSNQLIYIGRGYFKSGMGHKIRITNVGTGQCFNGASKRFVSADAAVFDFVAPLPVTPTTWGDVKARFED